MGPGGVVGGIDGSGDPPRFGPAVVVTLVRTDGPFEPVAPFGRNAPERSASNSPADQAPAASAESGPWELDS
jgi:hypothetical protein